MLLHCCYSSVGYLDECIVVSDIVPRVGNMQLFAYNNAVKVAESEPCAFSIVLLDTFRYP